MNVTAWERWWPAVNGTPGHWAHNHIEDGHSTAETPADGLNRGWAKAKWNKAHAVLGAVGPHGAPVLKTLDELDFEQTERWRMESGTSVEDWYFEDEDWYDK